MGAVNHSLSPSFFSRKSGYWTHCSWKTFLATKAFRPKLLKCHCVNSAFPGHSMKMQILIQGALSFCIFNKLPRDTDSAGQGNSHFYSKTLSLRTRRATRKCYLSALTWCRDKRTAWTFKRPRFKPWICPKMCYWAILGFRVFICKNGAFSQASETIEWDIISLSWS